MAGVRMGSGVGVPTGSVIGVAVGSVAGVAVGSVVGVPVGSVIGVPTGSGATTVSGEASVDVEVMDDGSSGPAVTANAELDTGIMRAAARINVRPRIVGICRLFFVITSPELGLQSVSKRLSQVGRTKCSHLKLGMTRNRSFPWIDPRVTITPLWVIQTHLIIHVQFDHRFPHLVGLGFSIW